MPEEREIEKQLRAAARQRRKDAVGKFELHPASRRLLQGEVVRSRGRRSAPSHPVFWPRFAWGTSMLAVLAVGVWALVSSQKKSEIISLARVTGSRAQKAAAAKDEQHVLAESRMDGRSAQAAATSEPKVMAIVNPPVVKEEHTTTVAALDRPISGAIPAQEPVAAPSVPKEVASATPPAVKMERTETGAVFDKVENKAIPAQEQAAAMPAPKVAGDAIPPEVKMDQRKMETAYGIAGSEGINSQEPTPPAHYNFSNAVTVKRRIVNGVGIGFGSAFSMKKRKQSSVTESSMLKSFQIELAGNQIRIMDRDGSVYDGTLLAENSEMGVMEARQSQDVGSESLAKSSDAFQSAPIDHKENRRFQQNFSFVAAGTNFSLGQRVTIKGEFSADASAAGKSTFNGQNISAPPLKAKLQNKAGLTNGRIIGRAVTADGQVIEMNASQLQTK